MLTSFHRKFFVKPYMFVLAGFSAAGVLIVFIGYIFVKCSRSPIDRESYIASLCKRQRIKEFNSSASCSGKSESREPLCGESSLQLNKPLCKKNFKRSETCAPK